MKNHYINPLSIRLSIRCSRPIRRINYIQVKTYRNTLYHGHTRRKQSKKRKGEQAIGMKYRYFL